MSHASFCVWVSFVSCPLLVCCKADVLLSLSEVEIKLRHAAMKVEHGIHRFRGSIPNVGVTVEQDYSNIPPVLLPYGCPLETSLVLIPGLKSTAVNHHKSRTASNIPLTHWQTNLTSKQLLQRQKLLQLEASPRSNISPSVCWNHRHTVVPCLEEEEKKNITRNAVVTNQLGDTVVLCYNTEDWIFPL